MNALYSPSMSLQTVTTAVSKIPFGATDCSLPMSWALKHKAKVDVFIVYTDNETYFGEKHPAEVGNSSNMVLDTGTILL